MFEVSGEPFDFERTELYEARCKKDRFNRKILCEYLEHFGLRPFDDSFYCVAPDSPALLLEQIKPVVTTTIQGFTLEQVVSGDPWKRKSD